MFRALLLIPGWIAAAHDRWRTTTLRRRPLAARIDVLEERVRRLEAERDLLRARLRRLPLRRRPRYRPPERLAILWHQRRHGLSVRATARAFVLSATTVIQWHRDVAAAAARIVKAKTPLRKIPDLVAEVAHRLRREWPRWGTRRIAGILARLGLRVSRSTVQRMLRRPHRPAPAARAARRRGRGPLRAHRPNHVWLIDFTRLGGPLRSVWIGAVLDAFSRSVLAVAVTAVEPPAAVAVRLLRSAVAVAGAPAWVVTDRGRQFRSRAFGRALARRSVRRRWGALGRSGSIALLERHWRSLKTEFARGLFLYRPIRAIERDVAAYATWFNGARPHQGLDQRTPDEVHSGRSTSATSVPVRAVLEVGRVGGHRDLPVLRLRPAA